MCDSLFSNISYIFMYLLFLPVVNPNKWYQSQTVVVFLVKAVIGFFKGRSHSWVGAMVGEGKLKVDKINGQNFQLWKMQMEDYLY